VSSWILRSDLTRDRCTGDLLSHTGGNRERAIGASGYFYYDIRKVVELHLPCCEFAGSRADAIG